jgi:hypothetical protein
MVAAAVLVVIELPLVLLFHQVQQLPSQLVVEALLV